MGDLYGSQDVTIRNDDGTKVVSVITDGSIERLAVNTVGDTLKPRMHFNVTTTAVSSAGDTSLLSVTARGRIYFIGIEFAASTGIVILKVDGTEIYRVTVATLGGAGYIGDGLEPIASKNGNKKFIDVFDGVDFATSFELLGSSSGSTNVVGRLVKYSVA